MSYIGGNGVNMSGGTDYGSGLGFIPQSSIQGLGKMSQDLMGELGSFGSMPAQFGQATPPSAQQAPAPQQPAPGSPQQQAEDLAKEKISGKAGDNYEMLKKALLYGGGAVAVYLAYDKFFNKGPQF